MAEVLCISVTFLDPVFHGLRSAGATEWPPSPHRLFQAFVAGMHTGARNRRWKSDPEHAKALQWLEGQPPPDIVAPPVHQGRRVSYFVPNNSSDRQPERQERLARKTSISQWLIGGDTVHYLWRLKGKQSLNPRNLAQKLDTQARSLLCLGRGIDVVVARCIVLDEQEVARLPGDRWTPWVTHRALDTLCVPSPGSLNDLLECHQTFLGRLQGKQYLPPRRPSRFDSVCYLPSTTMPPRAYAAFEFDVNDSYPATKTVVVAAMLRSLACRQARGCASLFPNGSEVYVAGHIRDSSNEPQARFSYLPLPSIGHPHADARIRRVLIAEPPTGDGRFAKWAEQALRGCELTNENGARQGALLNLWRPASRRMVQRYTKLSCCWQTVTPVVLPGHDDNKQEKAERLLLKAVAQAGLPRESVAELTLRKAPFWPGSSHARRFFTPNYLRTFPRWHAWIRFYEPLPGPIALGAGRHVGLGLFAATTNSD